MEEITTNLGKISSSIQTEIQNISTLEEKQQTYITANQFDKLGEVSKNITKVINGLGTLELVQNVLIELMSIDTKIGELEKNPNEQEAQEQLTKLKKLKLSLYTDLGKLNIQEEYNKLDKSKYGPIVQKIKNDQDAPQDLKDKLSSLQGGNQPSWLNFF